jgi:hypothetical protein
MIKRSNDELRRDVGFIIQEVLSCCIYRAFGEKGGEPAPVVEIRARRIVAL